MNLCILIYVERETDRKIDRSKFRSGEIARYDGDVRPRHIKIGPNVTRAMDRQGGRERDG